MAEVSAIAWMPFATLAQSDLSSGAHFSGRAANSAAHARRFSSAGRGSIRQRSFTGTGKSPARSRHMLRCDGLAARGPAWPRGARDAAPVAARRPRDSASAGPYSARRSARAPEISAAVAWRLTASPARPHWQLVAQFCSRGHMAERGRLSSRATFSGGSTFSTGHFFAFAPCPSARRPTRPGSLLPAARGWRDVRGPRTVSPDTTPPAPHPALAAHRPGQFAPARTVHGRGWRD
jgi:hypothetical protein